MKTYIIAEIASNHDSILYRAKDLIYLAKEAGASAVKFQFFRADSLVERRNASEYWAMYKANEMPDSWLPVLRDYANALGIDFLCTAYDAWGLMTVDPYVSTHKIASFEAQDLQYLSQVRQTAKPTILSTGMMNQDQVVKSIDVLGDSLWAVLHCTSAYPAPISEANLRAMPRLNYQHNGMYGLSDHTPGITCPVAAVALGARIIEKHFTDDRMRLGPDHRVAIEPSQFKQMVTMIREVEQALGTGVKQVQPSEAEMQQYTVKISEAVDEPGSWPITNTIEVEFPIGRLAGGHYH